ncbi:MAG: nucleotidyltransferase family protein [Pseudomonadota bacterium]|nr:nucleotidyltransferase family protein [Pseudomonadota bacterium]
MRGPADHLRLAGAGETAQRAALQAIILDSPLLMQALDGMRQLDLPDAWIVAGAIYNTVWNTLTGRDPLHGINDVDVFYFDGSDLSFEAEDRVIRRGDKVFADLPVRAEIRNQARVHLWFEDHFGQKRPPLTSCRESIGQFASKTHCVGARLNAAGGLEVFAPYGLEAIFSFRLVPNRVLDNRANYAKKAQRHRLSWPELEIEEW